MEVDNTDLNTAIALFSRWSTYAKNQPSFPKPHFEQRGNYMLERLASCRNDIDRVDEKLIAQATTKGFSAIIADVQSSIEEKTESGTSNIDQQITAAISERRKISYEIAEIKFALGTGTTDRLREQQMRDVRYDWGRNANLTEKEVDGLMIILMQDSKRVQNEAQKSLLATATK